MPAAPLTRVAVYRRCVAASIERVWENVFDWEHLPWLHNESFDRIEHLDSGDWGWRARIGPQPSGSPELLLELLRAPGEDRYVARTLEGPGAGTEIWTSLTPDGERTGVEVEFHLPGVAPEHAEALGAVFVGLYTRLWDEDESMMLERSAQLAGRGPNAESPLPPPAELALGPLAELRAKLPLLVPWAGRLFRIVALGDDLAIHACVCPHRFGPLQAAEVANGRIRCAWHGYEFDLATGRSSDGRGLRLAPAPRIEIDAASSEVRLLR